jgi:hypothetical protein
VLVGVTIALAFGKQGLIARLRNGGRYISRISGTLLVLAGGYIVWFWGTSLASGADALGASGPFRFVEDLSQRAQNAIAASPSLVALILVGVIAAGIVVATVARRQGVDVHD